MWITLVTMATCVHLINQTTPAVAAVHVASHHDAVASRPQRPEAGKIQTDERPTPRRQQTTAAPAALQPQSSTGKAAAAVLHQRHCGSFCPVWRVKARSDNRCCNVLDSLASSTFCDMSCDADPHEHRCSSAHVCKNLLDQSDERWRIGQCLVCYVLQPSQGKKSDFTVSCFDWETSQTPKI